MSVKETVQGQLDWSVTGIQQLEKLDQRLTLIEQHMGQRLPAATDKAERATNKLNSSLSGERLAKYGTSVGLMTGQMQKLGVQNEMVARTTTIVTETMMGMTSPIYLAVAAVGALATGIGYLVLKHRENEQAIKDSNKSLLDTIDANLKLAALENPNGALSRMMLSQAGSLNASGIKEAEERREFLFKMLKLSPSLGLFSGKEIADMTKEANQLAVALVLAYEQKNKLLGDEFVGPTAPVGLLDERKAAAATAELRRTMFRDARIRGEQQPMARGEGRYVGAPGGLYDADNEAVVKQISFDRTAEINAQIESEESRHLTLMLAMRGGYAEDLRVGYDVMYAGLRRTQEGAMKVTESLLLKENKVRLTGLNVAKYVGAGLANALAEEIANKAEKKAMWHAAEAIGSAAVGDFRGAGLHAAAAAGFAALGGAVAGMGAAAMRGSERDLMGGGDSGGGMGRGSDTAFTRGANNPGASLVSAGAAPSTINYNVIVTYQGAVIFGDGGTRDYFYNELVPLIREARSAGAL